MILFFQEDIKAVNLSRRVLKSWIKTIVSNHGKKVGEVNFIFCSNEKILDINLKYLNHNYFTDIITFDYCTKTQISGDIYISIETVIENSKEFNVSFSNELHRVIIHGILHLLGYDDKSIYQKNEMTKQENVCLDFLFNSNAPIL